MNLEQIKEKLAELTGENKNKKKYEKIDYTKIYWKPQKGKQVIRIIPSKYTPENPFTEMLFYSGLKKFPILSLKTFSEEDPIFEFASKLYKEGLDENDESKKDLAKKLFPKLSVFVPVIVRGEEELGVRLWRIGKETYTDLLMLADDEDYGDYTDVNTGRDLTLNGSEAEAFGRTYIKVSVTPKPKTSKAGTKDQIEKWLNEQPNPFKINQKRSYDELKKFLQEYLTPNSEKSNQGKPQHEKLDVVPVKTKEDKFKDIFEEDENKYDGDSIGQEDDLPF